MAETYVLKLASDWKCPSCDAVIHIEGLVITPTQQDWDAGLLHIRTPDLIDIDAHLLTHGVTNGRPTPA